MDRKTSLFSNIGNRPVVDHRFNPKFLELCRRWITNLRNEDLAAIIQQDGDTLEFILIERMLRVSDGQRFDIPIFHPEPFTEVSSVEHYRLDELLWQMSDRLMEQYQRHFMIRRPGHRTVGALTPYVKSWHVRPERIERYVAGLLSTFRSAEDVDRILQQSREELERAAQPTEISSYTRRNRKKPKE